MTEGFKFSVRKILVTETACSIRHCEGQKIFNLTICKWRWKYR